MAAATLLSATIKFHGSLHLQLQGDGPVNLLLVEVTAGRTLRGLATWDGEVPEAACAEQVGNGRLAITIDPGGCGERYQGVVAVEHDTIAAVLESYFSQSEQLATRLWLAAGPERASGMLLQQLPDLPRTNDDEDWNRDVLLGETVTAPELLELSARGFAAPAVPRGGPAPVRTGARQFSLFLFPGAYRDHVARTGLR